MARSDLEVERLLTGSSLFAVVQSAAATIGRAWTDSRTFRWLRPIVRDISPPATTDRLRVAGVVAIVGSLAALALQAAGPPRTRWLDSILPAGVAVAGFLVVAAARPIARALADTRP